MFKRILLSEDRDVITERRIIVWGAYMPVDARIGIIIYIVLIIQVSISATALFMKAKRTPVLFSLLSCHVAILLWLFFGIIEDFTRGTDLFQYTIRLTLIPIFLIGPLYMIFTLFYIGAISLEKSKRIIVLVLLPAILCYLPLLTNDYFHLVIGHFDKDIGVLRWGLLFYITTTISHLYFWVCGILIIYRSLKKKVRVFQNIFLVAAVMFSSYTNILTGMKVIKSPGFDLVPISFSLVLAVISVMIFKYKIINVIPFAYHKLYHQINSAVLIIDRDGNIDEYNKTLLEYFERILSSKVLKHIYSFLDVISNYALDKQDLIRIRDYLASGDRMIYEDKIRMNSEDLSIKQFTITILPLSNTKRDIGKLIVIKDVTRYMAETLSDERDRLSGDLHDSLGNCINIISSNLEYALKNFDGNTEIKECLEVSYAKATSAFVQLRRIVEELKPVDIESNGLLWALSSMFYKLRMRGLNIEFTHNNIDDDLLSKKKHGEVIYYVCQEAMNNSLIHGRAENITITLLQTEQQVKLYISDDGIGCSNIILNRGIRSMERRTTALGGRLEYGSPSEGGFNLRAIIPIEYQEADDGPDGRKRNDQNHYR